MIGNIMNASFRLTKTLLVLISLAFISNNEVLASSRDDNSLQKLLFQALTSDPRVKEAKANVAIAETQTKISNAGHYPILSLTNTQMLSQRHRDEYDKRRTNLGVKGQVNLYSWGGIEAGVERDKHKEKFYKHKYEETREQLGQIIGSLYLAALRAKENISAYKQSLVRHQQILNDVSVISEYDEGRASEMVEVESRLFQVQAAIADQERILQTALSKLSRYTKRSILPENLQDPFARTSAGALIKQYHHRDLAQNPTYLAQQQELDSAKAETKVAKAKRLPALNLEGNVNRQGSYEVYLGVSWNFLDMGAQYAEQQSHYSEEAAKAKLEEISLEVAELSRTAEVEMKQNVKRSDILKRQINAQKEVVDSYELQFKIARRSLLDVLNAYQELSNVEIDEVNTRNDFRDAALAYLVAQSQISNWAGVIKLNLSE